MYKFHIPRNSVIWIIPPETKPPEEADKVLDYGWFQYAVKELEPGDFAYTLMKEQESEQDTRFTSGGDKD